MVGKSVFIKAKMDLGILGVIQCTVSISVSQFECELPCRFWIFLVESILGILLESRKTTPYDLSPASHNGEEALIVGGRRAGELLSESFTMASPLAARPRSAKRSD